MANNTNAVDAVVAQEAIKQVDVLIAKLSQADAELIKISESALKAGKGISAISTPSGMEKAVSNTAELNAELAKQNKQIEALQAQLTKLSQVRAVNNKMSAEEAVNQRILNQNALAEAKSVSNLVGAYDKLSLAHQKAFKDAQNLGAQYGLTSKQFTEASAKANLLDDELKALDATLGKNTRNVGDYPGKFNALGNSISQLTREMPAFANSAQTGFMAISNNIPAFQDAITQMRAGGSSWGEVLKSMGGALFGLTGIISIATTLLVTLGPKLIDWITNTDKQKEATDRLTASIKKQNEQVKVYNDNLAHQNALAIENAKQRGATSKDIQKLERGLAEDQLKNFENARDARKKDLEDYALTEAKRRVAINQNSPFYAGQVEILRKRILTEKSIQKNALIDAENAVKEQGKALSILVEKQQTQTFEESKKAGEKTTKQSESEEEKRLKAILALREKFKKEFDKLSDEINSLQKDVPLNAAGIGDVDKSGKDALKALEKQQKAIENTKKSMEELHRATTDWLGSFSIELIQNSGLGSIQTFFDGTFNALIAGAETTEEKFKVAFNAIAESAQEVYNFINQNSEANFNAEKERLSMQKDISLKYAGENKEARLKIEEDYKKQQADIDYREAKAKQKQAIFNIAIDTAQAIVGALPNIPLSIVVGAIGAAQIAMVASQDIPKYFDGGTHGGGLAMINDAGGSNYVETVVTPDGKAKQYSGRDVVTNLPKGTEIYTPEQWRERQLYAMLNERGISMSNSNQYNGITKDDLYDVMSDTLGSQPQYVSNFDADGATDYIIRGGNKTIINKNRGNGRGNRY
jgi:DNA repair exonuclease SbcCD ATPase subunit